VYMESSSMFVRGGVYVVVRDAMGHFMARLSVSALIFDYILTGPISVVSAGQYLGHLLNEIGAMVGVTQQMSTNLFAAGFGLLVTVYFWRSNVRGIHESSGKALRIMQITTVMVVALLIWCPLTLLIRGNAQLPPWPTPSNIHFTKESLGWFEGTFWAQLSVVTMIIAFGHTLLAMSGFETLAQVYREIAAPKLKNLRITANIVCIYALVATGSVSLFAVMIIPDNVRDKYYDNLIGGLSMSLAGPPLLKLAFHIFVVIVGTLILSGAVNTSIIGANGILNRVAEDRVLLDWFRKPQSKYGTTYRIVTMIALLQIVTIAGSRGDVLLLGEAYAFGVVWSFFMKGLGVLALRFQRHDQEYKTPFNLHFGKTEIPIGLGLTVLSLFFVAIANLFSKKVATIYGLGFTITLLALFLISERINKRRHCSTKGLEEFNLDHQAQISSTNLHARPGSILVAVRGNTQMGHLKRVLQKTNLRRHDIIVMTVRPVTSGAGEFELSNDQIFSDYEQELFSKVVEMAEKEGKPVELLVVPAVDPFDALVQTATTLQASRLVTGVSEKMASEELARSIGMAWEKLPEPRHPFSLEIISATRPSVYVNLGPHPPRLWPEDVDRLHEIWLKLTAEEQVGSKLHHRDVVGLALRRLESDLTKGDRQQLLDEVQREMRRS